MKDANYWREAINRDSSKTTWGDCHEAFKAMVALHEWLDYLGGLPMGGSPVHRYALVLLRDCIAGEGPEEESRG